MIVESEDQKKPLPESAAETTAPASSRPKIRISINAPFVLILAGLGLLAMIISSMTGGEFARRILAVDGAFQPGSVLFYLKLVLHPLGHAAWPIYFVNFTIILLVGPLLEEKYGSVFLTLAAVITAVASGLFHSIFFSSVLLGASGIAFMMILLTSIANFRSNAIPLTFIIVVFLFMGREIAASFRDESISQFAHIFGGLCGAAFVFWRTHKKNF